MPWTPPQVHLLRQRSIHCQAGAIEDGGVRSRQPPALATSQGPVRPHCCCKPCMLQQWGPFSSNKAISSLKALMRVRAPRCNTFLNALKMETYWTPSTGMETCACNFYQLSGLCKHHKADPQVHLAVGRWNGWKGLSIYTPVILHSNGKWTRIEDVFPIQNGDLPGQLC